MPTRIDPLAREQIEKIARLGIQHAIQGLSQMVGDALTAAEPDMEVVPILQVPNLLGGPENEAVGIYLRAEGEMSGQFMLLMPIEKAFEMIDLLMGDPPGTARELDSMGRSALAEMGNLTGGFFLNAIANLTGKTTFLTPPAVLMDMVGAILNIIVAEAAAVVDEVVAIRTRIIHGSQDVYASFWYIPDLQALSALVELAKNDRL